jgi:protocatechuate 4,5-dioxygenase alpha subunit
MKAELEAQFEDIPGTYLFNRKRCQKGYHLNMLFMSLLKEENRKAFLADEDAYLDTFPLTEAQKQVVLKRDFNGILEVGGNIYYAAKLGATLGLSFQYMAGSMSGMSQDEYRDMMVAGGRHIEGNRTKSEK